MTTISRFAATAARPTASARPATAPAASGQPKPARGGDTLTVSPGAYNSLQKHGAFFDRDNDHRVTIAETADGLEAMGVSSGKAKVLAPIITAGLALPQGKLTSVDLDKVMGQIDTRTPGAFDGEGRFDAAKLEAMFAFDGGKTGSLTKDEVGRAIDASALPALGKFRTKAGYNLLFELASDGRKPVLDATGRPVMGKDGQPATAPSMSRARLTSFFEGTIFHDIAAAHGHPRAVNDGTTRKAP